MTALIPINGSYGKIICDCPGCDDSVVVPRRFTTPDAMRKWLRLRPPADSLWTLNTHYSSDGSEEWIEDYCSPMCSIETCWHLPPEFIRPIARMK